MKKGQLIVTAGIVLAMAGAVFAVYLLIQRGAAKAMSAQAEPEISKLVTTANADDRPHNSSPGAPRENNEVTLPSQRLRAEAVSELVINVSLPEGYHLNKEAPQHYEATITDGAEHLTFERGAKTISRTSKSLELPLRLPLRAGAAGAANVRVLFKVYYCRYDSNGTCRIKTLAWNVPVEVTAGKNTPREIKAQDEITL